MSGASQRATRRFPRAYYFLAIGLASTLTLLSVELVLRILAPVPVAEEVDLLYDPDPDTGFRLRPNSSGTFAGGIAAHVNKQGHRDDPVPLLKAPETFRILVLGDSFTLGKNVAQEQVYAQVLERLLRQRLGTTVEVVNAGVSGWGPYQYARYLETRGANFAPDLILVGFFVGNDTFDQASRAQDLNTAMRGRRVSRKSAKSPTIGLRLLAYQGSHLARLLMNEGRVETGNPRRTTCEDYSPRYLAIQRQRLSNHLAWSQQRQEMASNAVAQLTQLQRSSQAMGSEMLVFLIPDELQVRAEVPSALNAESGRYDFDMPQKMLRQALDNRDIETLDPLPAFRADKRCLYMNDTHWNETGHELAAGWLATELEARIASGTSSLTRPEAVDVDAEPGAIRAAGPRPPLG